MGRKNKNKGGNTHNNISEDAENVEDTNATTQQQQADVADQPMEKVVSITDVNESAPDATADPQQSSESNEEKVVAEEEEPAAAVAQEEQVDTSEEQAHEKKEASDAPAVEETTVETDNNTITNTTVVVNEEKEEGTSDQTEKAEAHDEEDKHQKGTEEDKKETSSYVSTEENKSSNSNNNTTATTTVVETIAASSSEDDHQHQPEDALNDKAEGEGEECQQGEGEGEKQDAPLIETVTTTETNEEKVEDDQQQEQGESDVAAVAEGEEKEEEVNTEEFAPVEEFATANAATAEEEEEAPASADGQEQDREGKNDDNEKASANIAVEGGAEEKEPAAAEDESVADQTQAEAAVIDDVAEEATAESEAEDEAEQSAEADNQQHDRHDEENNNNEDQYQDEDRDDEEAEEIDELIRPEVTPAPIVDDNAAVVPEIDAAVHFTDDERRFMTADIEAVEKSSTDAERAVRQRTADLRKALFTSKALQRLAATRVSGARVAAAIEGDVEVSAADSSSSSPSSSSDTMRLAKALGDKATTVEAEAAQLEADIANHTARKAKLVAQYHGSLEVLFALDRFEKFLTQLADHVKSRQTFAAKPQGAEVEESVLVRIRELTEKRNAELTRLEAMKERIKKTAAELRKGHVVERQPKIPSIAGNNGVASNAATTAAMLNNPLIGQRSSVAREDASTAVDADQEVTELREFNAVVGKEVETLNDALHRLTKERTALAAKLSLTKVSVRKQEANLNDELKQKSLRLRADTKAIEDLHRTNAALISTIETLMHQLNNEYYGAGDRPAIASTKAAAGSNAAAGGSGSGAPRMISGTKRLAAAPKTAAAIEDKKGPASPAPRRK